MKITVYVPCHNNEKTLPEVLDSLKNQVRPADEYLFINDRCSDQSPQMAADRGFRVLDLIADYGLAAGRNLAFEYAGGDILVGIDADVVLEPDFLRELECQFDRRAEIAAMCGQLRERYTDTVPDFWRSVHMSQDLGNNEQLNPHHLFGCTLACRLAALRSVGGWNSAFRTNYEDVDLSQRLRAAGCNLLYVPGCRAWHLRQDTLDSVLQGFWKWNYDGPDLAGEFASLEAWASRRLPVLWAIYGAFWQAEQQARVLSFITLLMPWSMMIRDLHALRKTVGDVGNLQGLVALGAGVLARCGAENGTVAAAVRSLSCLVQSLDAVPAARPAMHPSVLQYIERTALESISGADRWKRISDTLRGQMGFP